MKIKTTNRRAVAWIVIIAVIIVTGAATGGHYWNAFKTTDAPANNTILRSIVWRARLFVRKATGGVPDFSWTELWQMTRQPRGFGLDTFALGELSANASVLNRYDTDDDIQAGKNMFGKRCAICHGADGVGLNGPALNQSGHKHGDSDLAMYKVLRDGIPGTAMVAPDLSMSERWQVVGYLRTLMSHEADRDVNEGTRLDINVSGEQILSAGSKSDEWLTYSGSVDGHRYTPLKEITPANVSQLRIQWIRQFDTEDPGAEATPLVVNGVIFTTVPPSNVVALDAKSGTVFWKYNRTVATELSLCCGRLNRGVAILGHTLFVCSLDGYLVALDANSGKLLWETKVVDYTDGYSMTGAPLIVNGSVVTGVAGGDYGIRGFLAAYDPATGQQKWKFETIPGPGQPGHETWNSDGWRTGGGSTWTPGSYDPALDLLYWGVGNPGPDYNGDARPGDNLFTCSVIALHASTGKLAWYFQFTPHDLHDWDSTQTPVLTDVVINGVSHKVICWANRNGFYYVLDRVTGQFLAGVPFVKQTWAKGLDPKGRPILSDSNEVTNAGQLTSPAFFGGTNWQNIALDQKRGSIFVAATEGAAVFTKSLEVTPRDPSKGLFHSSGAITPQAPITVVRALDVATGAKKWEHFGPSAEGSFAYAYSGLLATGGGLVFGSQGGSVFALESATGRELWRVFLGGDSRAAPISFTLGGRQVVAITVGRAFFLFSL